MVSFDAHGVETAFAEQGSTPPQASCPLQLLQLLDGWSKLDGAGGGGCVVLVRNAQVLVAARDYRLRLEPGSVLVPDPRDVLQVRSAQRSAASLLMLRWPELAECGSPDAATEACVLPILHDADAPFAAVMQHLAGEWIDAAGCLRTGAADLATRRLAARRLLAAQREQAALIERCQGRCHARRRDQFVRLARARAVLAWGDGVPVDVAALAEIAHLSPAHFMRLFHRVFAQSPHRYRIERRMQLAYRMIAQTPLPIGTILRQIGLESHSTFSRSFRRHFGISASMLRAAVGRGEQRAKRQDPHTPCAR